MKEFKVIKDTHQHSKLYKKMCYVIVSSTYIVAEGNAKRGVYI